MKLSHISILIGIGIRVASIAYAEIQDKYFNLKYTDIDYSVYTDGANYVLEGGTPYDRHTYRYTPILAYMMTGNILLFESFGKVLFSAFDVISVLLMNHLMGLTSKSVDDNTKAFLLNLWLLNPLTIQVSTRGNADTLVVFLVYVTLYFIVKRWYIFAALCYGFVVHFKIYPIVYALPIYFYIDSEKQEKKGYLSGLFTWNRVLFALISGGLFLALIVLFYHVYPDDFLYQTYLYHLIRKDNRHNFSAYFYFIYLHYTSMTKLESILAFIPQFLVVGVAGWKYYKDLPFCMLIQTIGFVTFNKVCTAQYFVWWLALLPLAMVNNKLSQNKSYFLKLLATWLVVEVFWNVGAYLLEIRGYNAFTLIQLSCFLFFAMNIFFIHQLVVNHQPKKYMSLKDKDI